ncbi:hypothetical protein LB543_05115 [Mesorhizobium sp. ESP7-2]|uniref:hypothetical protein n=1 Tax=Mesorhizobium sp. ESP7-2 TaxID=2876622 RepID=UPI001CCFB5D5|nr:hypothetical protein [Mesorhizobium sp. ESP7-2]MBZ9706099.1 hypothetical protein [Mesorhizobium sp. ESP7-2]
MTLDDVRERFPTLGIAVYAMSPGEPVTLEIYAPDGAVFPFTAPTVQAAVDLAFPPEPIVTQPVGNAFD